MPSKFAGVKTPSNGFSGVVVKEQVKPPPPLKSFIEEIDGRGLVKIAFSEAIDLSLVTTRKLKEQLRITLLKPEETKGMRRLEENSVFEWDIEGMTEDAIYVKLNFSNAVEISQGEEQDMLEVKFIGPKLIVAKSSGSSLSMDTEPVKMDVPRQMPDTAAT